MKKIILTFALTSISVSGAFAQMLSNKLSSNLGSRVELLEKFGKKESENATGSPYVSKTFMLGNINGITETVLIKYNAYSDEIEINNGDDKIFILPKSKDYNTITLKNANVYRFFNYKDKDDKPVSGYLVEKAVANEVTLLKREKIVLIPEKVAATSYSVYTAPKFDRVSDDYYILLKDQNVLAFPKNKKKIIEIFPNKKSEIEAYFKTNKVSFKEEADMIKITQFIATL